MTNNLTDKMSVTVRTILAHAPG